MAFLENLNCSMIHVVKRFALYLYSVYFMPQFWPVWMSLITCAMGWNLFWRSVLILASFIVFFFGKTILLVETFVIIRKTILLLLLKLLNFRAKSGTWPDAQNLRHFPAIFLPATRTEVQTVVLWCWVGLYNSWFKSYDTKRKYFCFWVFVIL